MHAGHTSVRLIFNRQFFMRETGIFDLCCRLFWNFLAVDPLCFNSDIILTHEEKKSRIVYFKWKWTTHVWFELSFERFDLTLFLYYWFVLTPNRAFILTVEAKNLTEVSKTTQNYACCRKKKQIQLYVSAPVSWKAQHKVFDAIHLRKYLTSKNFTLVKFKIICFILFLWSKQWKHL